MKKNKEQLNKATKQFIADRFVKKWIKENKELLDDYRKLCEELLFFHASWGIEIGIVFNKPKENKGRGLGKGMEELFDAQKATKNINKYTKKKFTG